MKKVILYSIIILAINFFHCSAKADNIVFTPPYSQATPNRSTNEYQNNFGWGDVHSFSIINLNTGNINQWLFTCAHICGGKGITELDEIYQSFSVPVTGTYQISFSGTISGVLRAAGFTYYVGAGKEGFTIDLKANVGGVNSTQQRLYQTDLSWGKFVYDVVLRESLLSAVEIIAGPVEEPVKIAEMLDLMTTINDNFEPQAEWDGDSFILTMTCDLEAGQTYIWSFYPNAAVGSVALGIADQVAFENINVVLQEVRIAPTYAPGNHPPDTPYAISPSDGINNISLTPNLCASSFSDPDSDMHTASRWQIALDNGFTNMVYDSGEISEIVHFMHTVPAGILQSDTVYYWRVRYMDEHGAWSGWSSPANFCTEQAAHIIGYVKDTEDGNAVNASIYVCRADDSVITKQWLTGNAGEFGIPVAQGSYYLLVTAGNCVNTKDYPDYTKRVPAAGWITLGPGETKNIDTIYLEANKPHRSIVAWGDNGCGRLNVPSPNTGFVAISAGGHNLGLKADGSIVAWGWNTWGECDVPSPNSGFVAISAGWEYSLGLKSDGSIVAWGWDAWGLCNVPSPNTGFVAVSAGGAHSLGLKSDGSIVAWGYNGDGQCNVPSPNTGFVAIAAGNGGNGAHSLGLKSDGSIVAWGWNYLGQCCVPLPNTGFVAIAAGDAHSLGLKADGSIVAWGWNIWGQCNVPSPNSGFIAIAAGYGHSLGLKSDGSIVAWGRNDEGQCNVPSPNKGFAAIAACGSSNLAIISLVAGDLNGNGQENLVDFAIFAKSWMSQPGQPNWNALCDISDPKDNIIDWKDLEVFAENWLTGFVLLRDDFNGSVGEPLNSVLWTPYVDICTDDWGGPGGDVYQTGDGWAQVHVAPEWTGSGFYTTQTYSSTGQYHIEGRLRFTKGTNNADNIFILIRNPDNSYRVDCPYETYVGPQIRFDIHVGFYGQADVHNSVWLRTYNGAGWGSVVYAEPVLPLWSGTNTVVMSIDYNADTGEIDFKLYNADKTSVLTECYTTIGSQTLADIGATFRLEMGMDGYNSYDHFWDYIEITHESSP